MSKATDIARAVEREASKLDRLERVLSDLQKVTRFRREGLSMDVIAHRMGWTTRTLERWWQAAKVMTRKGIKMSRSSTHP